MTDPIQHLQQKLTEIEQVVDICHKTENYIDLPEIQRQKQMYLSSIHILQNNTKLEKHKK